MQVNEKHFVLLTKTQILPGTNKILGPIYKWKDFIPVQFGVDEFNFTGENIGQNCNTCIVIILPY